MRNLCDIPGFEAFVTVQLVEKGWSEDEKYYIETAQGQHLLLRVSDVDTYDRKQEEFAHVQQVAALGVAMSQPLSFGRCDDGKAVYSLLTWCDGAEAGEVLPTLPVEKQYALGVQAGQFLQKIHSLPAPADLENWADAFNHRLDSRLIRYRDCGLTFPGDEAVVAYIEANRHRLHGRPQCYQHGDYHVGNMIISPAGELFIIDFNREDFGDPWKELDRLVWSAAASPHFATGQLIGYFDGPPPQEFFALLAFYIAANILSSLPWAIPFGQQEVAVMLAQAQDVLGWFDNMKSPTPTWYLGEYL